MEWPVSVTRSTFTGSNQEFEIETVNEFQKRVNEMMESFIITDENPTPLLLTFDGWDFQQVDFSAAQPPFTPEQWNLFDFKGASLFGCTLPNFVTADELRDQGAFVAEQPTHLPFKPYRAFMYKQEELGEIDSTVYDWYLKTHDLRSLLYQTLHDYFVQDALFDYLENKTVVVIMGGHGMKRSSPDYKEVVKMGYLLARKGFVVATGGGPGAMEAGEISCLFVLHFFEDFE
jgi:hypothetical protein